MKAKKPFILCFIVMAGIVSFIGCGGGSTFNVQNPPPPNQATPSITFTPAPPQSMPVNTSISITATVSNDASNAGVDWSLTCPNAGNCGALSAIHTDSGTPVSYTPPLSLVGNSQKITIVVYATADQTVNQAASIDVTGFGGVLNGTYVFHAQGSDSNGQPYQIAGALTFDGSGDSCSGFVTSGQQTLNDISLGSVTSAIIGAVGSPCVPGPSYYFVGADGRGIISLSLLDPAGSGQAITESFSIAVLTSSEALIADISSTSSGSFSGSGTLELQDPSVASTLPNGVFAFVAAGADSSPAPIAYGGILTIDEMGNILGTNSLIDETNPTSFGGYDFIPCSPPNGPQGNVSWFSTDNPSTVLTVGLDTAQLTSSCFDSSLTFTGYIVDATHLQLIETDGSFFTAGPAIAQSGSISTASFSGSYVFSILGSTNVGGSLIPSSFSSVGVICPDGNGILDSCIDTAGNSSGGYTDSAFLSDNAILSGFCSVPLETGPPCPGLVSAEITAGQSYKIDSHNLGRASATLKLGSQPDPAHPLTPNVNFYLTGQGEPALVLLAGGDGPSYPALGTGIAYPQMPNIQTVSLGAGELYGVSITRQSGSEVDGTGQITSTLKGGNGAGTISGVLDFSGPSFDNPITGSFACPQGTASCPDSFGRLSNSAFDDAGVVYYLVDRGHSVAVETDIVSNYELGGVIQIGLTYLAQSCDVTNAATCRQTANSRLKRRTVTGVHCTDGNTPGLDLIPESIVHFGLELIGSID